MYGLISSINLDKLLSLSDFLFSLKNLYKITRINQKKGGIVNAETNETGGRLKNEFAGLF